MSDMQQSRPWKTLSVDGALVPFYIVPYDKNGICSGPSAADEVVASSKRATDVFIFAHGWNNDWAAATTRYDNFITYYQEAQRSWWSPPTRDYRPLLVGIFWPSTSLVAPWEQAPNIAAVIDMPWYMQAHEETKDLVSDLSPDQAEHFYALIQRDWLDRTQATELAALIAPALVPEGDELDHGGNPPTPEELVTVWTELPMPSGSQQITSEGGFIQEGASADVVAAGGLGFLPRQIARTATVLLMKDRAGRVGGGGVARLLRRVLDASPDARVHLVGHSYGCKIVLSALCNGALPVSPVESVLLLQPACSCLCFARDVDGSGHSGGYRAALTRSRQPLVTTYSCHDVPLTKFFHWAVRRPSDLGEAVIAGAPPSRYAALGGFGPQGAADETIIVDAKQPPERYRLSDSDKRIVAVRADNAISGHGDVTNSVTAWALLNQIMG